MAPRPVFYELTKSMEREEDMRGRSSMVGDNGLDHIEIMDPNCPSLETQPL